MAEQPGQERTEKATSRKREKAREKGNIPKSREINSVLLLGGGVALFALAGSSWLRSWVAMFQRALEFQTGLEEIQDAVNLLASWGTESLSLLAPLFLVACTLAVAGNVAQVGFIATPQALSADLNRINPLNGWKRLFSLNGLAETLKSLLKVSLVGWIAYQEIHKSLPALSALCDRPVESAFVYAGWAALKLVLKVWMALLFLALCDLLFQRWNYERELRMTKQELREEFKESEGDPHVKARIRSLQKDVARKRMMQQVRKADVVVTNPEHVAVVLLYERSRDMAPRVVAKGAERLCERIKELAREHGVPIVENPPLARFLYRNVKLDREIPGEVYRVVAEILAQAYRIKGRTADGVRGE